MLRVVVPLGLAVVGALSIQLALADAPSPPPQAQRAAAQSAPVPVIAPEPAVVPVAAHLPPPVLLRIPALGLSSPVQPVGLAASGALQVPAAGPHYDEAAWYTGSPSPGAIGPAVLVGHVDSARNGPSVFFELGALHRGDRVHVTLQDRSVSVFAVDSVARYAKTGFPTDLVYGRTSFPALRLITCGGDFDRSTGHYEDNVVVLAHLVRRNTAPHELVAQSSNRLWS